MDHHSRTDAHSLLAAGVPQARQPSISRIYRKFRGPKAETGVSGNRAVRHTEVDSEVTPYVGGVLPQTGITVSQAVPSLITHRT